MDHSPRIGAKTCKERTEATVDTDNGHRKRNGNESGLKGEEPSNMLHGYMVRKRSA